MRIASAGAGSGGPTQALVLHSVGIEVELVRQALNVREFGVGIDL